MSELFLASYVGLCCLIAGEAYVLNYMMRATLEYQRQTESRWAPRMAGTVVPNFRAVYSDSNQPFTNAQLRGEPSVLLFVSADYALGLSEGSYRWLLSKVQSKFAGLTALYAVCRGTTRACSQLDERSPHSEHGFRLILDERGAMTNRFEIEKEPSVVAVDDAGCIRRVGNGSFRE